MKRIYKLMIPATVAVAVLTGSAAGATGQRPERVPVVVEDISIPVAGQAPVRAFLVHPVRARPRSLAGVLYLHWFAPPASNQDRDEFLAEAVDVASGGAVAVLPQLTYPWLADPVGDARDRAAVEAQLAAVTAAYHALIGQRAVDPSRTAVVGHDYGAMYGAVLAQRTPSIRTAILMAPDATWGNWFAEFWLQLPADQRPAYSALFAGLDPKDNLSRLGSSLYLQFGGQDGFVSAETRAALTAGDPAAKVSLYDRADHFLEQPAQDDRLRWLHTTLSTP